MKIDNRQACVLLVDDNPLNMQVAGRALQKEGYDLHIVGSGSAALELIKKIDFDLILMDIMMPHMDGFETYGEIKQIKNCEHIPLIFLTARTDIESVVRGFELGAVDYIRKPFNELEMKARVKTHVELKKIREELEQKNQRLKEAYEQLEIVATTDMLTKLMNRREMLKRIEHERARHVRNKQPFAIAVADIDYFKKVNDTYGHECGDLVLMSVANILQAGVRGQDCVGRWGGEEFLIMLPDTGVEGAALLAERLRYKVEDSAVAYGHARVRVTLTFGICVYDGTRDLNEVISGADTALYEGKQNGRNRVVVAGR